MQLVGCILGTYSATMAATITQRATAWDTEWMSVHYTALALNMQAMQVVQDAMVGALVQAKPDSGQWASGLLTHFANDKAEELPEELRAGFAGMIDTGQRSWGFWSRV